MTKADLNHHIRGTHGGVNPNSANTPIVPANNLLTTQQTTQTIQVT